MNELTSRERARAFAREARAASRNDGIGLAALVEAAHAYLAGELESQLDHEEGDVFPELAARGKRREVDEAMHQHAVLRGLRYKLIRVSPDEPERARDVLAEIGAWLERHLQFEDALLDPGASSAAPRPHEP